VVKNLGIHILGFGYAVDKRVTTIGWYRVADDGGKGRGAVVR